MSEKAEEKEPKRGGAEIATGIVEDGPKEIHPKDSITTENASKKS